MNCFITFYTFISLVFVNIYCEVYNDRPKIKTRDGNLILEPARDKNIYLLPNGPQSNVFIGDVNLLNVSTARGRGQFEPPKSSELDNIISGPQNILNRIEILENQNTAYSTEFSRNISLLWTKVNRLMNRLNNLQRQINNKGGDECRSHTCQNGGTCLNLMDGYHCLCPSNWEGRNCEVDVNECRNFAGTDLGCQNGADCINRPGTYECHCRSGWFGLHCTRREKDCSGGNSEMCGHGTCIPVTSGDGIKCICDQGWTTNGTSSACLTDIDECDTSQGFRCSVNPKVDCINLPGTFRCGPCPSGYEGDGFNCTDIDECVTIPNGGCSPMVSCHNTIGSRICGPCPPGYIGDGITCTWRGSCNINRGGCHPSAQCIDNMGGQISQCICPEGMDGDGIGLHGCYVSTSNSSIQTCQDNPCGLHGQCHVVRNGYTCLCFRGYTGAHCNIIADTCANNPCQNGGQCRPDESTTRGFRCECTAQFKGSLCQIRSRNCGGVIDAAEGSILFPLTNTSYEHNSKCAWIIHTSTNKVLNVTFTKFNLEPSPECQYDFLQIHDGRSSSNQLIGRFCGSEFPKGGHIISSHNNLYLWFLSDATTAKDGFALHWTSIDPVCGGEVNATVHGQISSPGSPGKYPPNRDCYWHLTTTMGKRIQLHFFQLDIESHANCSFDYLAIYEGQHSTDPLLNKYCNSTLPAPLQSAGSELLIHFHSDAYSSGNGFQITYAPIDGIPGCGGYYTAEQGEIVSPSYDGTYLNNIVCEYKIKTSPDTKIQIEFKSFKLERSIRCKYDYLKVYDGSSSDSRLVGRFCGTNYPKSYISSSNNLYIKFKTDRTGSDEGFRIIYKTLCHVKFEGDSGIIKSPGYPFNYPRNKICEYIINAPPGKAIQLTFQDFDIEDSRQYNCQYDNVEIRDGPDVNSTLLGRFCGGSEHMPPVQTSTLNVMHIRFQSDMSFSGTGFYANYTTIDIECGGIYRTKTGLINHPSGERTVYRNRQSCTWILIAPEGMHIKLSWNRFDLERMSSCEADYLEMFEIDIDNKNETMGKYCGNMMPPAVTTSTNRLLLHFVSDDSLNYGGFSVSYSFLDEKAHCGGTFVKTHGFIFSPGWPKPYEPNRDCTWIIIVPTGQQIQLNISQFELERPIRNKCDLGDYLEIRNGAKETSPLIGKYCGKFKWKRLVSTANSIYLHFRSDYYLTGKGFQIEWDGTLQGCGGTLTSSSGSISSPNYPEEYKENSECFYRIVTSQGSKISIKFVDLDLEDTLLCRDDHVDIFDGRDSSSRRLGRFCKMTPTMGTIETSGNYAFIKFRADFSGNGKGFYLDYSTICINNITGTYGIIESPDFPNVYPNNLNCSWNINVPEGNKINITFSHFDIRIPQYYRWWPPSRRPLTCNQDYLQVIDVNAKRSSNKVCGSSIPPPFSSTGNSLQVRFVTNSYDVNTGFRMEWVSYGCGGHIQKSNGRLEKTLPSNDKMECQWLIETPLGTSILLVFSEIYMKDTSNCTSDSIEVYNGPTVQSPLLSKFCHKGTATFQSSTNFMLVRLHKKSALRDVNFAAGFSSTSSTCGGIINSRSGIITSKNYPQNYDSNVDCMWTITVPRNHRIELNFIDFDLFSHINYDSNVDSCDDSIRLYDDTNLLNANYTHIICPDSRPSQFVSKSNTLMIQFVTDNTGSAKGFKANFSMTCGATITAVYEGDISNDKYINHSNRTCTWTILAPNLEQKVFLTITHLSLPKDDVAINSSRQCPSSFLRILDGNDENAPLVDEYCGNKIPPTIVSHGNAVTVQLGTYTDKITGYFSAHYTSATSACGGTLTSEQGTITSPNYPQPYPVSADCEWKLVASPGNRVFIIFELFNINFSEECNVDYLEVREKDSAGRLLGLYCGDTTPSNTTITSNQLYITFHSNTENPGKGFVIRYGFLHGNDITDSERGEIASPLYPLPYDGSGEYWWRVTSNSEIINIYIDKLEVHSYDESCYDHLSIYDGYNDDAPLLKQLCGVLIGKEELIKTTSNAAFIKLILHETNSGSFFHLRWSQGERIIEDNNEIINCGSNGTQIIAPGQSINFNSPNYPQDYDNDLNCEWVYKASFGRHLTLHFVDFSIEEMSSCFADYLSIYTSDIPAQWKPIKQNICQFENVVEDVNGSAYMKINFHSDSSVTGKGFLGQVKSSCGGTVTDSSGVIEPTISDCANVFLNSIRCDWNIKVEQGNLIKVRFEHFNITNKVDDCQTYVILRNGDSLASPFLASGKYCGYSHENRSEQITSSNNLFVTYVGNSVRTPERFQNFKLCYEEQNVICGTTATLDSEHPWEIINSPNYPSVPDPYSECNWVLTGPPGEILRIDFIDRFDLQNKEDCSTEVVEIHDGPSVLSQLKGRFCKGKPSTIKTSSNSVFIKFLTQLQEPSNGFKANISIDVCGGTINANVGEVLSPGYPNIANLPPGTVCEWHIEGKNRYTLMLKPQEIDLPESESLCATKVTIEEVIPTTNTVVILKKYCNEDTIDYSVIPTSTNKVTIKYYVGKASEYTSVSQFHGFRFTFNSSMPSCGGRLTIPEGYLTTPGYPRDTTIQHCYWLITVPDETRRITLEILDVGIENKVGIYNDLTFESPILYFENTSINSTFESSSNKLAVYVGSNFLKADSHRFKAKFSSIKPALCGGTLNGLSGDFTSPILGRSYACEWHYQVDPQIVNSTTYKTIYITGTVNSSAIGSRCRYHDPKLYIRGTTNWQPNIRDKICNGEISYRIPSSALDFKAVKDTRSSLYFHIQWNLQACGGIIQVGEDPIDILNFPKTYKDSLDCAWIVKVPPGNKIELKLEGTFQLDCASEFLKIRRNIGIMNQIFNVGDYCIDKPQNNPIITPYHNIYIEYHSKAKSFTNVTLIAKTVIRECGGVLTRYDNTFASPNFPNNYPNNIECIWEIKADLGFRVSLHFINRFIIEKKVNCTKDAVIIYDWKDDTYIEIARLCGRDIPPVYNSTSSLMKVIFRSDNDINLVGFQANWSPICGGIFNATTVEQYIYSPGYPFNYWSNMDCSYQIKSDNQNIILKFETFELEGPYPRCDNDNLTIVAQSPSNSLYEVYCGSNIPEISHSYTDISMIFKSDRYLQKKGFKLAYYLYACGGQVKEPTVLTSGPFKTYDDNMNCTWFIEAPENKKVVIKLVYIDLESTYECNGDFIAMFDGLTLNTEKRLALLCGHENSTTLIRSSNNTMTVQFVSDSYIQYNGFKLDVLFVYSESVGCGGTINMTSRDTYNLKSPFINSKIVYENNLDCHWNIFAPMDRIIKIKFTSFHVAPCRGVNQTAIGISKCDCDLLEIRDGINPNSLIMGTYCGHSLPPSLVSSADMMSVRLSTDGETVSSGFEATISVQESPCGQSSFTVSYNKTQIKSPGYDIGRIARGVHCVYNLQLDSNVYINSYVHIRIIDLDLQPGTTPAVCDKDKLIMKSSIGTQNATVGKDLIINKEQDSFLINYLPFNDVTAPKQLILCGSKKSLDIYVTGPIVLNLQTSPDDVTTSYRGMQLEFSRLGFCGKNYTERYGRIKANYPNIDEAVADNDCYILITAPENYTISIYFISTSVEYWNPDIYLDVFDGNKTTSTKAVRIKSDSNYDHNPVFSTDRYILLHSHQSDMSRVIFDLNYMVTDKGQGCGGYIYNVQGIVTSPLYPKIYRQTKTCEWELETPQHTHLYLHFDVFDLGRDCDNNYVQLVDRNGVVLSSYCSETPADYTSTDNYVKIVFTTTMNNGGSGWVATFVSIS